MGDRKHLASIGYKTNLTDPETAWMRLHYKRGDKPEDYKVRLTTTRPNFGGSSVMPWTHAITLI